MTDENPPTRTILAIRSIAGSGLQLHLNYPQRVIRQEHRQSAETIARAKRPQLIAENKGPSE